MHKRKEEWFTINISSLVYSAAQSNTPSFGVKIISSVDEETISFSFIKVILDAVCP